MFRGTATRPVHTWEEAVCSQHTWVRQVPPREDLVSRGGLLTAKWQSFTHAHFYFRLIGEKTGNVGRGINIAVVDCKLSGVFFRTSLKALRSDFQRTWAFKAFACNLVFSAF